MIRFFGSALVAGCGIWFGNRQARQLERRVHALEGVWAGLEQMKRELELRCTPLPQLFWELSISTSWPAKELFSACAQALEQKNREELYQIWTSQVARLPELRGEERRLLASLGLVLGRYSGSEQGAAIAQVCRALEQHTEEARVESCRLGRVYRAMGAAGGGFLVILLL